MRGHGERSTVTVCVIVAVVALVAVTENDSAVPGAGSVPDGCK